jgi:superfamily I DNA/RNA helicase
LLLEGLNPTQRAAVEHGPGPLLILAGAGSGKTRVLTHRVAYMIDAHDVDPGNILAVTFTNKAAQEMRERIVRLLTDRPDGIQGVWVGTFHSVCARVLRIIADRFDYPRSFTIYDGEDTLQLIKRVMDDMSWSIGSVDAYGVRRRISDAKNQLLSPDEYAATHRGHVEEAIAEAYREYRRALRANRAFDFDDLLMETVIALRDDEQLLAGYRRKFRHVLVDEYQDTNHAQYQLVRLSRTSCRSRTITPKPPPFDSNRITAPHKRSSRPPTRSSSRTANGRPRNYGPIARGVILSTSMPRRMPAARRVGWRRRFASSNETDIAPTMSPFFTGQTLSRGLWKRGCADAGCRT